MFDIGFSELFMVALVALVVLGPERLPKAARFAGLWIRRARSQWQSVKSELENELADEDLKSSLRETRDQFHGVRRRFQEEGESLRRGFEPDRDRNEPDDDAPDYDEPELGSASDPELKAMMDPGYDPETDPPERDLDEPGLDERDLDERDLDEPERREPRPGEPERREPRPPGPARRDPPPGTPDDPAPDQRLDNASMSDRADAPPLPPDRIDHDRR